MCMWETVPCACSLSICMLFCFCTVCVHVSGASSNTGYSSSEPHAEEGIKEHPENLVPVIKECITADRERTGKERDQQWGSQRQKEGGDWQINFASVCGGIVFWVLIFWSVLRRKKCNIQQWISKNTLVYCTWGGGGAWTKWLSSTQRQQAVLSIVLLILNAGGRDSKILI